MKLRSLFSIMALVTIPLAVSAGEGGSLSPDPTISRTYEDLKIPPVVATCKVGNRSFVESKYEKIFADEKREGHLTGTWYVITELDGKPILLTRGFRFGGGPYVFVSYVKKADGQWYRYQHFNPRDFEMLDEAIHRAFNVTASEWQACWKRTKLF